MTSSNHAKTDRVLPGAPGFMRMSASDFNAHLLANPVVSGGNYSKNKRGPKRASPEEDLHRLVFEWILAMQATHPILKYMIHVPNGGARSKGEAGKLKAMGVRKGVADFICPFQSGPWPGFACELKAPKGLCTPDQEDFLDKAKNDGWITGVCYSLDQFVDMVNLFLGVQIGVVSRKQNFGL